MDDLALAATTLGRLLFCCSIVALIPNFLLFWFMNKYHARMLLWTCLAAACTFALSIFLMGLGAFLSGRGGL
jgi:hypothetical protein